jgi:EmbC-like arabinotransferase in arabinogalactan biosynthesis
VALTAMVTALGLVIGSFVAAPMRRPAGSLALVNVHRLTGSRVCGLADDVDVLPDGAVLARAGEPGEAGDGFVAQGGFAPSSPPPEAPGTGTSTFVWGSRELGGQGTGEMTSPWFVLPSLAPNGGVALSVSGRTDDGNALALDFGRSFAGAVSDLGERVPPDQPAAAGDPLNPWWRTVGTDAADVPAGADRVRIHAVDARTDPFGWLAFTGPRLRSVVPLSRYLAAHGPVLISWPMSFLFPCVHDTPVVDAGVAQTPNSVVEAPRPWSTQDRETDVGGSFTALAVFGDLREIPTRLRGHPDVDWGSLRVAADGAARDAYQRTVTEETVAGIGGSPRPRPER